MKVQNFLLTIVLSILTISCANSQKVVYADEANKLNNEQQNLLEHTKEAYLSGDKKILLPVEISALLGDSTAMQNIVTQLLWSKAYFVKDREDDALIIPLKANHNNVELFSELIVIKADTIYPKIVSTYLECKTDKTTEYIQIESTTKGEFYRAMVFDENNKVVATYGIKDWDISYGKEGGDKYLTKYKYSYRRGKFNYDVVRTTYRSISSKLYSISRNTANSPSLFNNDRLFE